MSGSSRDLIRQLNNLLENDSATDGLFASINQYLVKHNTLSSLHSNCINDELYNFYHSYVKVDENLTKQYLFLDILIKLCPILSWSEINLWLVTYMKPAIDSAGYDLQFVNKCRALLSNLFNMVPSEDKPLNQQRLQISKKIISSIIDIYSGEDYSLINLQVPPEQDQLFLERLRFVKRNCIDLLSDYGKTHSDQYFSILGEYLTRPKCRLDILLLVSYQLNLSIESKAAPTQYSNLSSPGNITIHANQNESHTNIGIFEIILDGLLYDLSDAIILSELSIIIMIIPEIANDISKYLDRLFTLYLRICNWDEIKNIDINTYQAILAKESISYKVTPVEKSNDYITAKVDQQLMYLATLLYGLFPLHYSKFCQNPLKFFDSRKSIALDNILETTNHSQGLITEKLKSHYSSFIVHPKFIDFDLNSLEDELKNPLKWIQNNEYNPSIPTEISLACFGLNPNIIINEVQANQLNVNIPSISSRVSRQSSLGGPIYLNIKDGPSAKLLLNNFNRKLSIVPTNLVIDQKSHTQALAQNQDLNQGIKFRDVKFGDGSYDDLDLLDTTKDPLYDLFSTHERLFHRSNSLNSMTNLNKTNSGSNLSKRVISASNAKQDLSDLKENSSNLEKSDTISEKATSPEEYSPRLAEPLPLSSPTASVDNKPANSTDKISGSALDYYHRELLILKNELEFSSYMKYVNKTSYIKLKLQFSKFFQQNQHLEDKSGVEKETFHSLSKSMKDLTISMKEKEDSRQGEINGLLEQLHRIQQENEELKEKLDEMSDRYKLLNSYYESNVQEVLPQKDFEIDLLRNQLSNLQESIEVKNKAIESTPKEIVSKNISNGDFDEQICELKQDIISLKDTNDKLRQELATSKEQNDLQSRTYESKIEAYKLEARENINSYLKQHDRKIEQLSTTILKYETLLEEKNSRIIQLTSSKPISIPQSSLSISIPSNEMLDRGREGSGSTDSFYLHSDNPSTRISPQAQSTHSQTASVQFPFPDYVSGSRPTNIVNTTNAQQQPILRGRGGYQKRSKKM